MRRMLTYSHSIKGEQGIAEMLKNQTVAQLVDLFEQTNARNEEEIPTVRGWIMDELESRDPVAFAAWIDSAADSPREFFK